MSAGGEVEVLVVGGGLAGAAAAILLARAGRPVVLLERSLEAHDKVCGEFLSAEALAYLAELGVDVAALGALSIERVDLAGVKRTLPFRAMSLTRRRLDEELLRLALQAGVVVRRGVAVQGLERAGAGWTARLEDGSALPAQAAMLATGKHDLRGYARPPGRQRGLVGLKMYFALSGAQADALGSGVELHLYRGGYAGLQPVEGGAANLCCLVDRGRLQQLGGRWDDLLQAMQQECPALRLRLQGARALLEKPLAIAPIPYGYVAAQTPAEPGLWRLGDQAAVIPSFTGDGMSIALHSGCVAAQMYLSGAGAAAFQQRLHRELRAQVALATWLSRGLVHPLSRRAFVAAVTAWPGLLEQVARRTRVASPLLDLG